MRHDPAPAGHANVRRWIASRSWPTLSASAATAAASTAATDDVPGWNIGPGGRHLPTATATTANDPSAPGPVGRTRLKSFNDRAAQRPSGH
jgi:hypothetical protein